MSDAITVDLPLERQSAGRARHRLEPFRAFVDESAFIDLQLLASELVAEALKASPARGKNIGLRARLHDDRVRVEVSSAAYRLPSRRPKPGDAGWGIWLVQRLAGHWGFRGEPHRATIWLDVP